MNITPENEPNDTLIDLSPEEQSAIDEQTAEQSAAAEPVAAAAPAEVVAEPVAEAKPDATAAALAEVAASNRAVAEQLAAQQQAQREAAEAAAKAAEPAPVVEPPRDFDKEFAALQQELDDGEIDTAEHATKLRALNKAEAAAEAQRLIADADARRTQEAEAARIAAEKAANDKSAADWDAATGEFFKDPGNQKLVDGVMARRTFEGAMEEVIAENPNGISYPDLLVKAREKVTGIAAVDTTQKVKEAQFERTQNAGTPAATLREVPNSGNPGGDAGAVLDNLDIDKLEDALARMSESDRNRYLAGAPGNVAA